MQGIFLCDARSEVERVYSKETVGQLGKRITLDTEIYTKADVTAQRERFCNTSYIFSTWGMPSLTVEELRTCFPALKAVFYAAGSVQYFARPFLDCGVKVFSAWAANAVPVAEYTVAQIVLANKGFFAACGARNPKEYGHKREAFAKYSGNYEARVGIIGAGMIGSMVLERLKAYEIEGMVYDPFLSEERAAELGVQRVSLEKMFRECAVISNHLANVPATRGLLNGSLFAKMPPNATFINTGRGAQVVEDDLIEVLRARPDLTALLDVTDPEPPQQDSALYALENCILTPHIAGSSGQEVHRMSVYMLSELDRLLCGEPTRYAVTRSMLETMA